MGGLTDKIKAGTLVSYFGLSSFVFPNILICFPGENYTTVYSLSLYAMLETGTGCQEKHVGIKVGQFLNQFVSPFSCLAGIKLHSISVIIPFAASFIYFCFIVSPSLHQS